jgi:hypothetical protein
VLARPVASCHDSAAAYSLESSRTEAHDVVVQLVHILVKGILYARMSKLSHTNFVSALPRVKHPVPRVKHPAYVKVRQLATPHPPH